MDKFAKRKMIAQDSEQPQDSNDGDSTKPSKVFDRSPGIRPRRSKEVSPHSPVPGITTDSRRRRIETSDHSVINADRLKALENDKTSKNEKPSTSATKQPKSTAAIAAEAAAPNSKKHSSSEQGTLKPL